MIHTGNIHQIAKDFLWQDQAGLETRELGRSTGSRKLYANLDTVPPGAYSTKYHTHSQQEEFFYILSGKGTLRLNGAEQPVNEGDFLAKPAGEGIGHTFYNSGEIPLLILDVGTVEPEDTCYYPDEDIYLHKMNGTAVLYRRRHEDEGWSSLPNP